jgi:hypothetical protein
MKKVQLHTFLNLAIDTDEKSNLNLGERVLGTTE